MLVVTFTALACEPVYDPGISFQKSKQFMNVIPVVMKLDGQPKILILFIMFVLSQMMVFLSSNPASTIALYT